jgi:predicted unusual protein kinase regulating ubiquinone biosynthesis (AarF/ABC1/UbiB family)
VRDLPTRGLVRGARLAAVPASFVGRRAVGLGRRVSGRPAELIGAEVQARTAEQLFAVLGELKGGAMKVGQWMSAMEAALPDQLAGPYGEALTRLQEAAPPMSTSRVQQVLAEELGRDWRDLFARFDDAPAAAASIGQVHGATWHDGRAVAVKVQYPRAGEALATDLRQLGRLVPLIRVAAPGLDARGLFTELRSQLMAEVDYRQEAAAQTSFADAFQGDADFLVPPVVEVTDRVLVSEWVAGAPVAVIARRGERRQRRRAALLLTRFLLSSPSRVGRLHGDPHPGNFRLTDDGRLAVLDFGCSLPMPNGWPPRLEELLRAGRDLDSTALFETATATGLVGSPGVTPAALLDLLAPLLEPLRHDEFTFDRAWMRSQTLRVSDPRAEASRTQRRLRMPVRHLLVQRVAAGTTGVLCLLGVPVPVLAEVAAWMPELRPPS